MTRPVVSQHDRDHLDDVGLPVPKNGSGTGELDDDTLSDEAVMPS
jgi:hypothetical protein